MSYEIEFTTLAQNDLKSIQKYICEDNFEAAQSVVKHIIESIEVLKDAPSIGRAGRVIRTKELVITKYPYIVPYQVKQNIVYTLRILHTSKKWERIN